MGRAWCSGARRPRRCLPRRWSGLWEVNATRELQACVELGQRLQATMPESPPSTVVHGDYRLGNVMISVHPPARLVGILDWEMAAIGGALLVGMVGTARIVQLRRRVRRPR